MFLAPGWGVRLSFLDLDCDIEKSGLGGLCRAATGLFPLFYLQARSFDAQLNPLLSELAVEPILGEFLLDLRNQIWMDVLSSAFHLGGVTELIVRPLFEFGIAVLAGETAWACQRRREIG